MFAARDHRRPRAVAALVVFVVLTLMVVVAPLVFAAFLGPSAPRVRLPAIERYDTVGFSGASVIAPRGGGPSLLLPVAGGGMLVLALGWFLIDRRVSRRRALIVESRAANSMQNSRRLRRATRRTGRWWPGLVALILAVLIVGLTAQRYTTGSVARDVYVDQGRSALAPSTGSVLDINDNGVRSVHPLSRVVALTFDDGPDPRWTPAILDVLAEEHVPGTFFVIGEHVVEHPELARRVIRQGGELGVHTYRHLEISTQSPSDFRRDLRLTQLAIIGATGRGTALFRPPFITDRSNVGRRQYLPLREAARDGYLTVLADRDSTDWSRPTGPVIALRSLPMSGAGAIIEMHDGGGRRAETVKGLRLLIRLLRDAGYQFTTVSGAARLPASSVMPRRGGLTYVWGRSFITAMRMSSTLSWWFMVAVFLIAVISVVRSVVVVAGGLLHRRRERPAIHDASLPPVSVLIAAFNEEASIDATLAALCGTSADGLQIVVVDDGSTDGTAEIVKAFPDPRVELVTVDHVGKAGALAAGLPHCTAEFIVTIDADTQVTPEALGALVAPLGDRGVGGVSGNLRVADPSGFLGAAQHLEYVIGNSFDRRALDLMDSQVTIPGAAGAYRRAALDAVGGFDGSTVAEDTDLTLALVSSGWKVRFAPEAIALTSTPATVRALWRQRSRWSFGITQAVWRRRSMMRQVRSHPRASATWLFVLVSQVVLPLAAPLLDLAAIWALFAGVRAPLVIWIGFGLLQFGAAAIALRIEGQSLRWLRAYPLHLLGYRQLTACVVVQTVSWSLAGRIPRWGTPRRLGSAVLRGSRFGGAEESAVEAA